MTQPLQSALQQAIRSALGCANDFNGDLHAMCQFYDVPEVPISGRLIAVAQKFDPSITDASSALNYFLQNPQNACGSLALDFVNSTTLDPRITFTRASQATLFDSTGTLKYAKHNLALQSEDFSTTWLTTQGTVVSNQAVSPSGTLTADEFEDTGSASGVFQSITIAAGGTYTASVYLKRGTTDWYRIYWGDSSFTNGIRAWANLSTGVIGTVSVSGSSTDQSASIANIGNGWYRVSVTGRIDSSTTSGRLQINSAAADNSATRVIGAKVYLWGAQLNLSNMEGGVTSSLDTYYPTTTAAYYAPRFDHDPTTGEALGLLIEEQRTNSIRNNTMQGAVAGSPGTLPTNWTGLGSDQGLTRTIVGVGVENGITYIDVQWQGTLTSAISSTIFASPETTTSVVAASGQTWTGSCFVRVINGSLNNFTSLNLYVSERTSAGALVTSGNVAISPTGLSLPQQRYVFTRTLAGGATVERVTTEIRGSAPSGVAIDITLRIGLPQLELGAFATSVIPTTTASVTRNADVATMTGTNFSNWFNAAQGTVVCAATRPSSGQPFLWMFSNGATASERYYLRYVANQYQFIPRAGGVDGAGAYVSAASSLLTASHATAYVSNQNRISSNGFQDGNSTKTLTSQPTNLDTLYLGSFTGTSAFLNGTIQKIAFYPTGLSNAQLQALTG